MADKEDHVVSHLIGDFGRWQATISALVSLLKLPIAWFQLSIVFLAPEQKFWCDAPGMNQTVDQCSEPCDNYIFDTSVFSRTIISEWNLVCDRGQLSNVAQMIFMFGVLIGNVLFGVASDKYGRKKPLILAITLQALTGFILAFIPWFWGFLLFRFLLAISTGGTMVTSFVLCVEVVGGKWRTSIPILYQIPFGIANSIMSAMAYVTRDWRQLTLSMSVISAGFISYHWLIPESPRWLLATGRSQAAAGILKDAAKVNRLSRTDIDNVLASEPKSNTTNKPAGFWGIFRTPNLRRTSLSLFFNWFTTGMSAFGFTQYMSSIGESNDIFINFALGGLVTLPGTLLCIYVVSRFGRRSSIVVSGLVYGISCVLVALVPEGQFSHDWPRIVLAAISLTSMAVTFPALYLYSGELLPTVARNGGMGAASMFARLGSMLAPFILATSHWHSSIPLIILGGFPIFAVLLIIPLPETRGCALPDSLEDGENFGKREKPSLSIGSYSQMSSNTT